MSDLVIRLKSNGAVIAQADREHIQHQDGNYYLHPDLVDSEEFEISNRVYNCPAKGVSYWVDLKTDRGWINDICWVYPEPKEKYQHIAGWFGFYPSHNKYEIEI